MLLLLFVLNEVSVCFPAGLWHRSMIQLPKDADGFLANEGYYLNKYQTDDRPAATKASTRRH